MRFSFIKLCCVAVVVLLGLGTGPIRAEVDAEQQATVNKAVESVKRFAADPDMQWFRNNVGKAKGVLIVPVSVKAGFIIGGSGGVGVFLARGEANDWSYPAFYQLASVTFGLQAGGDVSEIMMLVMSEKGRNALLTTEFKLGGEVSVAAGPVGAGAEAQTADVLAFSRTKGGVFGGLNVEGSVVNPKDDWNGLYYGEPVTPSQILVSRAVTNPNADPLRAAVSAAAGAR
jgi:lipid-binding SYLF domain-containing protein